MSPTSGLGPLVHIVSWDQEGKPRRWAARREAAPGFLRSRKVVRLSANQRW
jgi:hypothetical protein